MIKISKHTMGKMEVTVREHFPDDEESMNYIRKKVSEFEINQCRKHYSDEELETLLPEYQKILNMQAKGLSFEESVSQYIKEFEAQRA